MRHQRLSLLVGVVVMLIPPTSLRAQLLAPGARVRVSAPEMAIHRQRGSLLLLGADSLVMESVDGGPGATGRWAVPRRLITQLESSQGRRGHAWSGFLIGTAAGLTMGLLATDFGRSPSTCRGSGDYRLLCGLVIGSYTAGGGVVGFVVGGVVRTERWRAITPPRS